MLVKNLEAYMIVQKVGAQESSWNKRKKVGDGQKKVGQNMFSRVRTEVNAF